MSASGCVRLYREGQVVATAYWSGDDPAVWRLAGPVECDALTILADLPAEDASQAAVIADADTQQLKLFEVYGP